MPDLPVAEGGRPGSGGGGHWLAIGAIAGVGTLAILLLKGQGGGTEGKTTAAGTSINAALGSIQEQNLNLMGQLGASTNLLSTQADQYNQSTLAALSGMQNALSDQMTGVDSHLTDVNNSLSEQIAQVNNGVLANGQSIAQVGGMVSQVGGYVSSVGAQQTAYQNWLQSFLGGWLPAIYHQGDVISGQVSTVGNQVSNVQASTTNGTATLYAYFGNLFAQLQSQINALKGSAPAPSGGSSGGGGRVSTYTINLPGGGQIRTNANSYAAAVNNVAGMGY